MTFHGHKDDISNAKLEAIGLINEVMNKRSSFYSEFPKEWNLTIANQTSFDLVNLDAKSTEFLEVHSDFMAKSKNKGFRCLKVLEIFYFQIVCIIIDDFLLILDRKNTKSNFISSLFSF